MVASRTGRRTTLEGSDVAVRPGRPSAIAQTTSPSARHHLLWFVTALASGWMAATIAAVAVVFSGFLPGANAPTAIAVCTAMFAIVTYARFRRLGRIDEAVVLTIAVCWAAMLGLLSL